MTCSYQLSMCLYRQCSLFLRVGLIAVLLAVLLGGLTPVWAADDNYSVNAGQNKAQRQGPFSLEEVAGFQQPWSLAPLPDGGVLVTEKSGNLYQVEDNGHKMPIAGLPEVYAQGQNGLLAVALAPDFSTSQQLYLSYIAPKDEGGVLSLLRATLVTGTSEAKLQDAQLIWQQQQASTGGHPGGIILFAPDGQSLFLTAGERMLGDPAQDLDDARGKILHLGLDGTVPANNPWADAQGERAYVWSYGHRNPYGLAFDSQQQLWSHEMGPKGGDEFNLIQAGKNYGWPLVSNGDQYDGRPIPDHQTRPDLEAPLLYWTPVISPSGLAFYKGLYEPWQGSALIGGLSAQVLVRVAFDEQGRPYEADRFAMGQRIRDVGLGPEGQIWVLEDAPSGRLLRLQPN